MAAVRSVRFSDLPAVRHPATAPPEQGGCTSVLLHPPRVYDDALYSPYDIYTAASIGDAEIVEAQLQSGFDPNRTNTCGWTALMYSAYLGHEVVCATLLKYGASVDMDNQRGQTALMLASACGNLPVVRLLLRKGARVDKQDKNGSTALGHACACSQTTTAEALLEAGADPNIPDASGMTPTLTACSTGHELTIIALLQNDGDVKICNSKGEDGEALAFDNPKAIAIINDPPPSKKGESKKKSNDITSLSELLSRLKLDKYVSIFEAENIDLKLFVELNDTELMELGVKAFGPRKKMLNAISRYRTEGTFLTSLEPEGRETTRNKDRLELRSEQVTNELMECQQQLAECQQELRKSRKVVTEQMKVIAAISEAGKQTRKLAYNMLEEIRHDSSFVHFEKDLLAIIRNIDEMSMKMTELPRM
uniref:NAD(+) ADP-ribosyltransferase n=1 Tax=Parascaris univalens TaxID=6257 RepID=A0A915C5X3_PARUN